MKTAMTWVILLGMTAGLAWAEIEIGKTPAGPFKVSVVSGESAAPDQATPVTVAVRPNAQAWPPSAVGDLQVELLVRLPEGVLLESKDWKNVQLPPGQPDEENGPWTFFQRTVPVKVGSAKELPSELLREAVPLKVVKEGSNWVITVRARIVKGAEAWENFGVLFATLEGKTATFHEFPQVQE